MKHGRYQLTAPQALSALAALRSQIDGDLHSARNRIAPETRLTYIRLARTSVDAYDAIWRGYGATDAATDKARQWRAELAELAIIAERDLSSSR